MERFSGKIALVSGGASGIGAATVRALAANGAQLAVLDLDAEHGAAIAKEVGGEFYRCDVTDAARWREAIGQVIAAFGGLDLVHLNAGIMTRPPQAPVDDDIFAWIERGAYRRIMSVNIDGVVLGLRAVLPALEKRGGGSVVATASIAGLIGFSPDPFYTMTKHAVVGLVRGFAPILAPKRIRLNAICPGGVDTPLVPDAFRGLGLRIMPATTLAAAVLDLLESRETGEMWVKAADDAPAYRYDIPRP